ncbi:MAG TPA: hypothetical protein VFJ93_05745 [Gaiellaceae bacterium]|nr:hypothetical protein [Gaiellaceae bacterium]
MVERQRGGRKTLGRLVSELLARARHDTKTAEGEPQHLVWNSRQMRARVDLEDKEAVRRVLEG